MRRAGAPPSLPADQQDVHQSLSEHMHTSSQPNTRVNVGDSHHTTTHHHHENAQETFIPGPPLQTALHKLQQAAFMYNSGKDPIVKQGFLGRALTPPEFQSMLRRMFGITLAEHEVLPLFEYITPPDEHHCPVHSAGGVENVPTMEGELFIAKFLQLGQAERHRLFNEHRELDHQRLEQARERAAVRDQQILDSLQSAGSDDFTDADLQSALAKVRDAATHYDKYSASSVSLSSFEVAYMSAGVFSDNLRRVFNVHLTPRELGAMVAHLDSNGTRTVDCPKFLVTFFKTGFQERSRLIAARRAEESSRRERELAETKRHVDEQERKLQPNFTEADRDSAMAKLTRAATMYDSNSPSAMSLSAFEGAEMPPHVFREQLRRVFNVKLTPPELGAVMELFDKDGGGALNSVEFVKEFFRIGFVERTRLQRLRREEEAGKAEQEKAEAARKAEEALKQAKGKVDYDFSDEDRVRALTKVVEAAIRYDKNHPSAMGLEGFDGAVMEPQVFQDQLRRVFHIRLDAKELGAVMRHFDKDQCGTVNCAEFLKIFFRLGFQRRTQLMEERHRADRDKAQALKEEAARKLEQSAAKNLLKVSYEYTPEDETSALAKIHDAAIRYDKNHPSAMGLEGFAGSFMPPHVFKEQLRRVFNVKLSPPELGAVMRRFDKDGDKTVDCQEFLSVFFKMGQEGRYRILQRHREEGAKAREEAVAEDRRRAEEAEQKAQSRVAPFTSQDVDEVLDALVAAAARHDRRALGPAGLKAWEVAVMTPTELREAFKRTFSVILPPPQLGVLVRMFDASGAEATGEEVFIPGFLHTFFKMSAATKGMLGHRDTKERLRAYRQKMREELLPNMDALPAPPAPPPRPSLSDSGAAPSAGCALARMKQSKWGGRLDPSDPQSRLRIRLAAARETHRLDLSTSQIEQLAGEFVLSTVPKVVCRLSYLTELWLTNNSIAALPAGISALTRLELLGVAGNCIEAFAAEIGQLTALRRLLADGNLLKNLPPQLSGCAQLRELRLGRNSFTAVPECVLTLHSLEVLHMPDNAITTVPDGLWRLRRLADLDLDGNPIGPQVPEPILALRNLTALGLQRTLVTGDQRSVIAEHLALDSLRLGEASPELKMAVKVPTALAECRTRAAALSERELQHLDLLTPELTAMLRTKAHHRPPCGSVGSRSPKHSRSRGTAVTTTSAMDRMQSPPLLKSC